MGLKEKFEKEIRTALKAGRKDAVAVFRLTLSEIQAAEKEKRSPLEESEIAGIIRGAVKKRKEAVVLFRKGGRSDLVEKETAEAQLLEEYLPAPLPAAELSALVEEGLAATGASSPRDLGMVMKWIIPRVEGRAEGSEVSRLVREKLSPPA
jgi:uncharacterized protein YqeY